jgi:hypothetical protein
MTRPAKFHHGPGRLAPPPGLDRMRPREVRLTAGGWALLALAAVLVVGGVAGGIALHLKAARDADVSRDFQERALDTTGVVTRKWRARDGDDRPRWVAYDFSANGRVFRGEARASRALWERLEPGSPVPARFDPDRPERHFPWGRRPGTTPPVLAYFVGLAGLLAGGLVTIPVLRQRRLMAEGRAARATVTGKTKGEHGTIIDYEFHVLSGGLVKGSTGAPSKPPEVGSTMWVVYATEDPRWSRPYPSSLVRLAHETSLTPSRDAGHGSGPASSSGRRHARPAG